MPDNSIFAFEPPTPEQERATLEAADARVADIIDSLRRGESGDFCEHKGDKDWRQIYPMYEEQRLTENFRLNDACIECRLCEEICPECVELCPKDAIEFGDSTVGRRRFFNRAYYERSIGIPLKY